MKVTIASALSSQYYFRRGRIWLRISDVILMNISNGKIDSLCLGGLSFSFSSLSLSLFSVIFLSCHRPQFPLNLVLSFILICTPLARSTLLLCAIAVVTYSWGYMPESHLDGKNLSSPKFGLHQIKLYAQLKLHLLETACSTTVPGEINFLLIIFLELRWNFLPSN